MVALSVVIIAFNEEINIVDCIRSAKSLSHDIIVVDSGSIDNTCALAEAEGATVIQKEWAGYGAARNAAADEALNEWIFALDADERISPELSNSILALKPLMSGRHLRVAETSGRHLGVAGTLYGMKRINFCEGQPIRFGTFASDKVYRLYNKTKCAWDNSPVHEEVTGYNTRSMLAGRIDHYTIRSRKQYEAKLEQYALLNARKYLLQGKKAGFVKLYLSPVFGFIKGYVFQLGFLDGSVGFWLARVLASYTKRKYFLLNKLNSESS